MNGTGRQPEGALVAVGSTYHGERGWNMRGENMDRNVCEHGTPISLGCDKCSVAAKIGGDSLIARLRIKSNGLATYSQILLEAADEIERLRSVCVKR